MTTPRRSPEQAVATERAQLRSFIKRKLAGTRAFVASPNKGRGADRSVVLIGPYPVNSWVQAIKCWNYDHHERAVAYAHEYNDAPAMRDAPQ